LARESIRDCITYLIFTPKPPVLLSFSFAIFSDLDTPRKARYGVVVLSRATANGLSGISLEGDAVSHFAASPIRGRLAARLWRRRELLHLFLAVGSCFWGGLHAAAAETPTTVNEISVEARRIFVDANIPGGNIVVEGIDGDTVYLRPDLRDTEGWWFYWNFRVGAAPGRAVQFQFSGRNPIGVRGPAVSTDGGRSWSWLGAQVVHGGAFDYTFADDAGEARFCFAMPYQEEDLREFLARHDDSAHLAVRELCRTRKGRSVERLHAGRLDGDATYKVLLTARHHACEMMASYSLEGVLETVLGDDDDGRWFRRNVEVLAVPFMDKDGVEDGDQGKNRKPHDHNRDYVGKSIYPSVAALRTLVPNWSNGHLTAALDLHCPYIRGPHNEVIYIVGSSDEAMWRRQCQFGRLLERLQSGPLVYRASDNLPFGQSWNTASNFDKGISCSRWACGLDGIALVAPFEIPYANAGGKPVMAPSARAFGRSLGRAIRQFLEGIASQPHDIEKAVLPAGSERCQTKPVRRQCTSCTIRRP